MLFCFLIEVITLLFIGIDLVKMITKKVISILNILR